MVKLFHPISAALMLGGLLGSLAGGCQSYAPRPINQDARYAEFLERHPEAEDIQAFLRSIDAQQHAPEFNLSDGISLPEAELIALVFNADLRLARLRSGVLKAAADHAGNWEDPVLQANFTRVIQSVPHPWMLMTGIGLTLPVSGRLELEKQRAGAEHAASVLRAFASEWQTINQLRRVWLEWTALVHDQQVLSDLVRDIEELLTIVSAIEAAGELARVEMTLFKVEHATRRAALQRTSSAVRENEQRILRLMGLPPTAQVSLQPGFSTFLPHLAEAELRARRHNPGIAVALADYEAAERRLELEVRKQYPDLQIGPGYGREDGTDRALLGLSLPIPLLNGNAQGIAIASSERELAAANFDSSLEVLLSDLQIARIQLQSAQADRAILESELLPLIEQQYSDVRLIAELGRVDVFLLLDSLTRQQEAKLSLVAARLAEALAAQRLAELLGPPDHPPFQQKDPSQ